MMRAATLPLLAALALAGTACGRYGPPVRAADAPAPRQAAPTAPGTPSRGEPGAPTGEPAEEPGPPPEAPLPEVVD